MRSRPTQAGIVNSILQKAVHYGTGKRAYLPDRPVAGKTGTTENYGDAWFVGYTPQLAVAVWVGYPTTLKPMLTEFHGDAVTGGTFPALIWKSFVEKALKGKEPQGFPYPTVPYAAPKLVIRRGDRLLLDNGRCRSRQEVVYFAGMGPSKTANCLDNEVEVPDVRRLTAAEAQIRVEAQPLTPKLLYKPAAPLQPAGVVVDQQPEEGLPLRVRPASPRRLEADAGRDPEPRRPQPRRRPAAPEEAEARAADPVAVEGHRAGCSSSGPVPDSPPLRASRSRSSLLAALRERPAEVARAGGGVAPGRSAATLIPIRGPATTSTGDAGARSSNGGASSGSPSCSRVTPSAWQSRPGPAQSSRGSSRPRRSRISSSPVRRLERPDQHRRGAPRLLADEVEAPVDPVRAVDVGVTGRAEHGGVARRCGRETRAPPGPRRSYASTSTIVPPTPSTSSVAPIRSGATSCTLRAKKLADRERLRRAATTRRACSTTRAACGRGDRVGEVDPAARGVLGEPLGQLERLVQQRRGAPRPAPCRAGSSALCARRRSGPPRLRPRRASAGRRPGCRP